MYGGLVKAAMMQSCYRSDREEGGYIRSGLKHDPQPPNWCPLFGTTV